MNYYLGLDLGTGSIKTVLFDETGKEIAVHFIEYPLYQPHNGWSEQEPEDWYQAAVQTVKQVMVSSGVAPEDVKGLGISGQMMGAVMLDSNGTPLRRAILWNDGRTSESCEHVRQIVGDDLFMKYSLTPARPGLTAAKIQWVKDNQPEIYAKVAHILLPKDYLRYRLTGEYATEVSDASATQLLDVPNRCWAKEILEKMELTEDMLGKVYESQEITGYVLPNVAEAMGITTGCAVVGGASDNAAGGVGTGVVAPGRAMTTIGTSGTVFAFSEKPVLDRNKSVYTFCMPVPGAWHFMGSVNSCGASLKWWRNNYYPNDTEYEQINEDVKASKPGANRLIYLPYLNGEQSPHFNLNCRGSFIGLAGIHTKQDMTRAVMEGATYALRDILTGIRNCGVEPDSVRMCGGGSKSPFWRQLMCDIYNMPVTLPDMNSENSAALGVAILAMVGTGAYPSVVEACDSIIKMRDEVYQPSKEAAAIYDKVYKEFDALYPKLKENWKSILDLDI
ncbi:MAG: xylulokinase [Lachnospiraceae bacterium]|nr:xylulokinase [Lachnospiraceae bacterium]